ncbi:MAG: hypothetical protein GF390_03730 [Candidatus Pacebacteria bacterium]|nr:hypothetical protein [Candidatus Paceibacterota bacterium]
MSERKEKPLTATQQGENLAWLAQYMSAASEYDPRLALPSKRVKHEAQVRANTPGSQQ